MYMQYFQVFVADQGDDVGACVSLPTAFEHWYPSRIGALTRPCFRSSLYRSRCSYRDEPCVGMRPFISGGAAKRKEISTEVKRTALLGATGPPEERAAPVHCDIEADSGSYFPA